VAAKTAAEQEKPGAEAGELPLPKPNLLALTAKNQVF
jgi:hypothetical protein